jgi:hypothetical protein
LGKAKDRKDSSIPASSGYFEQLMETFLLLTFRRKWRGGGTIDFHDQEEKVLVFNMQIRVVRQI